MTTSKQDIKEKDLTTKLMIKYTGNDGAYFFSELVKQTKQKIANSCFSVLSLNPKEHPNRQTQLFGCGLLH